MGRARFSLVRLVLGSRAERLEFALAGGVPGLSPSENRCWALARRADDPKYRREKGSEAAGQERGRPEHGVKPDPESEGFAQPLDGDGVPQDMATLVLDNPAL